MNSFNSYNIPKLLQQHSFKVDPNFPNEDLTCNKCRMLIRDVFQVYCGCTYCRECINSYVSDGNQYCNGNKKDCKKEVLLLEGNVTRNVFLNNKILQAKIICSNDPCLYSGDLKDMEDHLRECKKKSVECGGIGCSDESLTRDTIENHINNKNNEHSRLITDWINESKSEIESLKVNLKRLEHEHLREIESLKEDSAKEINILKAQLEVQRKDIESLKDVSAKEIKSLKEDSAKKEAQMETERKEIETFKKDSAKEKNSLKSEIDGISVLVDMIKEGAIMSGVTTFTIDRIGDRMKIAKEEMFSPYFYSHNNGYKLRLAVFPRGHINFSGGSDTPLIVLVQICMGEFDTELPWPCKYSFHLSLVNQQSGGTHNTWTWSHDTVPDYCKHNFDRPISGDIKAYGWGNYILHSDLRKVDGLIVNDKIIIQCVVTAPK